MPIDHTSNIKVIRRESRVCQLVCLLAAIAVGGLNWLPVTSEQPVSLPAPVARVASPTVSVETIYAALEQCRKSTPEGERWRIAATLHQESRRYGYDPLFIAAMVEVESQCKATARGIHGAVGLIQIRPATARAVAAESGMPWKGDATLRDGVSNLRLGVRYLWTLEEQFDDPHLAIAAYNLGPTRVAGMARSRARGAQYVKRVLARYQDLVEQYAGA